MQFFSLLQVYIDFQVCHQEFLFAGRGTIHAHILLYFKNSPSLQTSELAFKVIKGWQEQDAKSYLNHLKAEEFGVDDLAGMDEESRALRVETLKRNYDEYIKIQKARQEVENFVVENLGISNIHPNMNPQTWKPPFGEV